MGIFDQLIKLFIDMGASAGTAVLYARLAGLILILLVSVLAYYVSHAYLLQVISFSVERTKTKWDDVLNQRSVFSKLANIAPAIVIILLAPMALGANDQWTTWIINVAMIYIIIVGLMTIDAFLNGLLDVYRSLDWSKDFPIRGFLQVFKIIAVLIAVLMIASIMLDQTVLYILGTLGAATAVLMLIFQDPILGLAAGIQLTANRMIARDDFITMPSFDADGTVIDIALTTIKIQNTDKSITTIPTQALISQSFKNWRGMTEAGGRRIKRSLMIDIHSVAPYDPEQAPKIAEYLQFNDARVFESNVSAFRAYALAYLKNHPNIHQQGFTQIVRALAPTASGLPIEIYAFSSEMDWNKFEDIQADIFDHLILVLPRLGLQLYQNPASGDFIK